jgi:hypothetical protein
VPEPALAEPPVPELAVVVAAPPVPALLLLDALVEAVVVEPADEEAVVEALVSPPAPPCPPLPVPPCPPAPEEEEEAPLPALEDDAPLGLAPVPVPVELELVPFDEEQEASTSAHRNEIRTARRPPCMSILRAGAGHRAAARADEAKSAMTHSLGAGW